MKSFPPIKLTVGNPQEFLRNLKQEITQKWKGHAHYHNNRLSIKNDIWEGEFRDVPIEEGLSITFVKLSVKQPCRVFHEIDDGEFYYHFYFDTALGQRVHESEEQGTPMGLTEKYSFVVMSSNTSAHTDIEACEINNVIVHMSRRFFYENVPVNELHVDPASWRKLIGIQPMNLYGACNDRILKVLADMSYLDLPDYAMNIYMKGSALQLISQTLLITMEDSKGELAGISNLKDVRALLDVNYRIEQHFDDPLPTIEEVAAEVHMSATKFKDIFKKTFGASYYTYYQNRRMEKARELLLSKKYSVGEVAGMVGFLNSGKFSKRFKVVYDILPKDLLKSPEDIDLKYVDMPLKNQHFKVAYR